MVGLPPGFDAKAPAEPYRGLHPSRLQRPPETFPFPIPLGGIGPSGMGHYHGHEGFLTFSKLKPVFHQSRLNGMGLFKPPYGRLFDRLVALLLR